MKFNHFRGKSNEKDMLYVGAQERNGAEVEECYEFQYR